MSKGRSRDTTKRRPVSVERVAAHIRAGAPDGWGAIQLCLIAAAHAMSNGQTDPIGMAQRALATASAAGYPSGDDRRLTRFVKGRITKWQTQLFAVNESRD